MTNYSAAGAGGVVHVVGDRIRIDIFRGGMFFPRRSKGQTELAIDALASITFRKAGLLRPGFILFADKGGGRFAVLFHKSQQRVFEELQARVQSLMNSPRTPKSSDSSLDDLEKLALLRDRGIVTVDEFEQKKKKILGL